MPSEIETLKHLCCGDTWVSASGVRALDFIHRDAYCLALTFGLSEEGQQALEEESRGTISQIEIPGSVYLVLAERLKLRPVDVDATWIEEHIVGPAQSEEGVDLEVVRPCLEPISVFQLTPGSFFGEQTSSRYKANYICTFDPRFKDRNRLSPRSLDIIREIFLQERDHLIEENLFEAMSTPLLRHAFLEVYRTLEFVFVLPRAVALLDRLRREGGTVDIRILDFARYCNKELGWKRVERDAVGKLFQEYASCNYNDFLRLSRQCQPFAALTAPPASAPNEDKASFVEKVAEGYYKLRNQVAHQFWPDEEIRCNDEDWRSLIEFTLGCISYLYERHLSRAV